MTLRHILAGCFLAALLSGCMATGRTAATRRIPANTVVSEPLSGLRLRLSVPKATYRTQETIHLELTLENVSDSPMIFTMPSLMDIISASGDTSYPTNHPFTAVISAQPVDSQITICGMANVAASFRPEPSILPAGGSYTLDIKCLVSNVVERAESTMRGPGPTPKHRREDIWAMFAYHDISGRYQLSAWYRGLPTQDTFATVPHIGKEPSHWEGDLATPPLEIQILK
jgi:hypothetical protein